MSDNPGGNPDGAVAEPDEEDELDAQLQAIALGSFGGYPAAESVSILGRAHALRIVRAKVIALYAELEDTREALVLAKESVRKHSRRADRLEAELAELREAS